MKKFFLISISLTIIIVTFFLIKAFYQVKTIDISVLKKCHKTKMYQVFLCPGGRNYTRLSQIAKSFIDGTVISEDGQFFSHKGFDWYELKESFKANLRQFSYVRGGSTITQQLVKNVFLTPQKSLSRKFTEAIVANKLEKTYSKNLILERYLNVIEFGKKVYGIKQAASHYFGKHPSELTPLESAFLTYLIPSPKRYSAVFKNKKLTYFAKKRIKQILRRQIFYRKVNKEHYESLIKKVDQHDWPFFVERPPAPKLPEKVEVLDETEDSLAF